MAAVLTEPGAAKAAIAGPDGGMLFWSFPIEKVSDAGDGCVEVAGRVTDGSLDSDLQIVDPVWSEKALREWFDTGANIRVQHRADRDPAGKGIHLDGHHLRARIVEPIAVKLVKAGVLQDFSIGIMNPDVVMQGDPRYGQFKHLDPMGRAVRGIITGRADGMTKVGEVSTVDRGSNFATRFAFCKAAADGSCVYVGELTAPDAVLAKVSLPRAYKTVSVDLPASMRIKVSPATLAKMNTMARRSAVPAAPDLARAAGPPAPANDGAADPLAVIKAAETAVYKRDIDTATRERLASRGRALGDGSYPIETHEDAGNAVTLALSGHGNAGAARKLIRRIAREEGWQDILDRLKGSKKAKVAAASAKAAEPDVTKCGTCDSSGMTGDKPCPDCAEGKKAAKAIAALDAAVIGPLGPAVAKKKKVLCGSCGAMQNAKHVHCPECGTALAPGAMPVPKIRKNHDFACLGCGKAPLDKGEPHCPDCGRENPGYLPEADRKIPANADAGKAAKERVSTDTIAKGGARKKGKKAAKGKGGAFGGDQAPPLGKDDGDDAKKAARAEKRRKAGKKKGGRGRSPADGVAGGQGTAGLPAHRDGGEQLSPIEQDAAVKSADAEQMMTAMRYKSLGVPPDLGCLHDLVCPAYHPDAVAKAIPYASLAEIDTQFWQSKALDAAGSGDAMSAIAAWNRASAVSRAAVMLKAADPEAMRYIALDDHAAFRDANAKALKVFRDAVPGPASFPSPGQPVAAGSFRRPYISAGHGAPSPMHDGPRSFPVPSAPAPDAGHFTRDYIAVGHAGESPQNAGHGHPVTPGPAGSPSRVDFSGVMRDDLRQARATMDDHLSRLFPGVCPVSPQPGPGGTQRPAPGVSGTQASPVPHAAGQPSSKSAKAKALKAAGVKAAKRPKARRQALKAAVLPPVVQPFEADTTALTAAIDAATAPLMAKLDKAAATLRDQRKEMRKNAKVLNGLAGQPDLTGAPSRSPVAVRKQASAAPAGPLTAAESAAQAQLWKMQMLREDIRDNPDPAAREASWDELMNMTGLQPMTPSVPALNRPLHRT